MNFWNLIFLQIYHTHTIFYYSAVSSKMLSSVLVARHLIDSKNSPEFKVYRGRASIGKQDTETCQVWQWLFKVSDSPAHYCFWGIVSSVARFPNPSKEVINPFLYKMTQLLNYTGKSHRAVNWIWPSNQRFAASDLQMERFSW